MFKRLLRIALYSSVLFGVSSASAGSTEDWFKALALDNEQWARQLLAEGADPNLVDAKGQTSLILALREGSTKVAALLAAHPAVRVDATNGSDETALMMACLRGQVALARQLIERGAAINRPGWSPLHYAATGSEPALVSLLLERGAAIDAASPNRSTPLMMAARYGNPDSAALLLARGADARLLNERGLSAADFARSAGRDALAQRLDAAASPK
jgi:uncharacterized protein